MAPDSLLCSALSHASLRRRVEQSRAEQHCVLRGLWREEIDVLGRLRRVLVDLVLTVSLSVSIVGFAPGGGVLSVTGDR